MVNMHLVDSFGVLQLSILVANYYSTQKKKIIINNKLINTTETETETAHHRQALNSYPLPPPLPAIYTTNCLFAQ